MKIERLFISKINHETQKKLKIMNGQHKNDIPNINTKSEKISLPKSKLTITKKLSRKK